MELKYRQYSHAIAGAGAGLTTVLLLHPLDTLRTHLQSSQIQACVKTNGHLRPLIQTLRQVVAHHGLSTLYRGLLPASVGSVVSWACYFQIFQQSKAAIMPRFSSQPTFAHLLSGTIAGVVTSFVTNPIWVVKVRLQLQSTLSPIHGERLRPYDGFLHGLATIVREEGFYGLYRGLAPSLWLVSHGAIQFTLYENIKRFLRQSQMNNSTQAVGNLPEHYTVNSNKLEVAPTTVADALLASTASKLIASVLTYPLQVARTRMQERRVNGEKYGSFYRTFCHIARSEGIRGLYSGLFTNVLRVTPQAAITFITYEQILNVCSRD